MTSLASYREKRDHLLLDIVEMFSKDERFVAAWLTGSYGNNDEDAVSDIDISLVVSDKHSEKLCRRSELVSAQTSLDRYSLFSQFGTPALIHENNNNAPESGTFTFVMYTGSAIMVDWILIPQTKATRPYLSRLLFDNAGISVSSPPEAENAEQNKRNIAEQWAFFWMMAAVTIKYIIRGDDVFSAQWIENLHKLIRDIERRLKSEPWKYTRGSLSKLQPTEEKQIESIRQLCQQMMELKPRILEFAGTDLATPLAEIETLLSFVNNRQSEIVNRKS